MNMRFSVCARFTSSLIKMLYWMCEKTRMPPTGPQLVHAIKRNFGGLEESGVDPEGMFFEKLPRNIHESPNMNSFHPDVNTCLTVNSCM